MRRQFVQAMTTDEAFRLCPWAATVIPCEGGYMTFESIADAEQWQNQT